MVISEIGAFSENNVWYQLKLYKLRLHLNSIHLLSNWELYNTLLQKKIMKFV